MGKKGLLAEVAYHKIGGQLYIYRAEPYDGETDTTVNVLGGDADYSHFVKVVGRPVVEPLVVDDFGYVDPQLSDVGREKLIGLVNKYRECFAKNLSELGCTPLMTVSINEAQNSRPVVCRPYKRCLLLEETTSPYASPVLLVKQQTSNDYLSTIVT